MMKKIKALVQAQGELNKQIDQLASQLSQFGHQSRTPILLLYVKKMNRSRERLKDINNTINQINSRLDKLHVAAQNSITNNARIGNPTALPPNNPVSFSTLMDSFKISAKTLETLNTAKLTNISNTIIEKASAFKFDGIPSGLTIKSTPPPPQTVELKTIKIDSFIENDNEFVSATIDEDPIIKPEVN